MNTESPNPKINLFALPSQTALLFWLLTTTLLGAVFFGSIVPSSPIMLIGWLPVVLILLSLRGFLERPDREIRQKGLRPVGERFPTLQETIKESANQIGLKRIPQVWIDEKRNEIYEMGSFRRWYIVCGAGKAQILEDGLAISETKSSQAVHGILLHELYHFKTGDYWQLGYLTELFQTVFRLMLWVMFFFVGWIFLLSLVGTSIIHISPASFLDKAPSDIQSLFNPLLPQTFLSESEMKALEKKAGEIDLGSVAMFVSNAALPLILLAAVLWRFYRFRIWQMREFYADSGMAQTMRTMAPLWDMLHFNRTSKEDNIDTPTGPFTKIVKGMMFLYRWLHNLIENTNFWPPFSERANMLTYPQDVFWDWKKTGLLLGSLMLFLEIFLDTPLTLPYIGDNPISFATLVVVMTTAYFILPHILMGKSGWMKGLLIVIVVNIIRTSWLLLTFIFVWGLYLIQPDMLRGTFYYAISSIARYVGRDPIQIDLLDLLKRATVANFSQIPIIFAIQVLSILILAFLFQRICNWHSFFQANQTFRRTIFCLNLWLLFILYSTVLPLGNAFLLGNWGFLSNSSAISLAILGVFLGIAGVLWIFTQDRRHYHQCPNCKITVIQPNLVGAVCPSCQKLLYPWLVANYEDE